jgi:hypothetical protein
MNKKILFPALKCFVCLLCLLSATAVCFAQEPVEMADTMRSNGKIYIVVAVCVTILIGLFIYIASVDRRLRKWEKEEGHKN